MEKFALALDLQGNPRLFDSYSKYMYNPIHLHASLVVFFFGHLEKKKKIVRSKRCCLRRFSVGYLVPIHSLRVDPRLGEEI